MGQKKEQNSPDQSTWDRADLVQRVALLAGALPESKMDKAKFEQLLKVADADGQVKLRILYNAVVSGIKDYGASGTAANLNNWKAAEKELDKYIEKLWVKHFQGERTFPNIPAVVRYLDEKGWKISQASVYNHVKARKLTANERGEFLLSAVDRYATDHLRKINGSKSADETADQSNKSRYEEEILRIKSERMAHDFEVKKGAFVPRDAFERALAQRAALFKSDLEAFIRGQAAEMISLVGGDPEKAPDLIDHMLDQFEKCLGRYAKEQEWTPPTVTMEDPETDEETDEEEEV